MGYNTPISTRVWLAIRYTKDTCMEAFVMLGWLDETRLRTIIEAKRSLVPEAAKSQPWLMSVVDRVIGQRIHKQLESFLNLNSGTYSLEPFTRDAAGNKWFYNLDERKFFIQKREKDERVVADPKNYVQPRFAIVPKN